MLPGHRYAAQLRLHQVRHQAYANHSQDIRLAAHKGTKALSEDTGTATLGDPSIGGPNCCLDRDSIQCECMYRTNSHTECTAAMLDKMPEILRQYISFFASSSRENTERRSLLQKLQYA